MQNFQKDTLSGKKGFYAANYALPLVRASDISGANSRKNRPISRDFRGEKVKIRGTIGRFCGRKVKIRKKVSRFRRILAEKKLIFEGFSGANS